MPKSKPGSQPDTENNIEKKVGEHGFQHGVFDEFTKLTQTGKELLEKAVQSFQEEEKEKANIIQQVLDNLKKEVMALLGVIRETEEKHQEKQAFESQTAAIAAQQQQVADKRNQDTVKPDTQKEKLAELEKDLKGYQSVLEGKEQQYKEMDKGQDEVEDFMDKASSEDNADGLTVDQRLQDQIDLLSQQIKDDDKERMDYLDKGDMEKYRDSTNKMQAKIGQVGALRDMQDVRSGEKQMCDGDGNTVTSMKDAKFIIGKDEKIVKEDGQHYLLGKDEELTDKNRQDAKENFEENKGQISSVRSLVNNNKLIDMLDANDKISGTKKEMESVSSNKSEKKNESQAQNQATSSASASNDMSSLPDTDILSQVMERVQKALVTYAKEVAKNITANTSQPQNQEEEQSQFSFKK